MAIDHSRHAFHGADVTESLPVRPVSMHILLRMIVRRSSNMRLPSSETAFHVGSTQRTDVDTRATSVSRTVTTCRFSVLIRSGDHCAIQAICLYRTRRSPKVEVPER